MDKLSALALPLRFVPSYMPLVWGGRRLERWRQDLPEGPIGESWELADHPRGMSVLAEGALAGTSLQELTQEYGKYLLGQSWNGGPFPLLIKIIDAQDRLSVQVHPDDLLAQQMGVGNNGKTECWLILEDDGKLYQGTRPGIDRAAFEQALAEGHLAETLNQYAVKDGDFFFIPARTVHALGAGCLLVEVQQNSDTTFRVYDWDRLGLDGQPRPLHIAESMQCIDFTQRQQGPLSALPEEHPQGGSVRRLITCDYFSVEERICQHSGGGREDSCSILVNLAGEGSLATAAGACPIGPMQTWLISACAGPWTLTAASGQSLRTLVSYPL